ELIHTRNRNTIDVVVEDCPGVAPAIGKCEAFAWHRRLQCCGRRCLEGLDERQLHRNVRGRTRATHVSGDQRVEIHCVDFLHLSEVGWNVLCDGEPAPRHPTRKDDVYDHQRALLWRIDEDVPGQVRVAVV